MRILIILLIFIGGCASTSFTASVSQDNKDVLILSILVQDHLRKTNRRSINLAELLKKDTLNRISNSFKSAELKLRGGFISVYYNFSESRDSKRIVLTNKENELRSYFRWKEKDFEGQYDGEIRLDYGERFYRVKKIIVDRRN